MKSLFLEDTEAVIGDRLPAAEKSAVKVYEIKRYVNILKPNKALGPDRIKKTFKIYQKISDITIVLTASDLNNKQLS